jgi:hypothetical protein
MVEPRIATNGFREISNTRYVPSSQNTPSHLRESTANTFLEPHALTGIQLSPTECNSKELVLGSSAMTRVILWSFRYLNSLSVSQPYLQHLDSRLQAYSSLTPLLEFCRQHNISLPASFSVTGGGETGTPPYYPPGFPGEPDGPPISDWPWKGGLRGGSLPPEPVPEPIPDPPPKPSPKPKEGDLETDPRIVEIIRLEKELTRLAKEIEKDPKNKELLKAWEDTVRKLQKLYRNE